MTFESRTWPVNSQRIFTPDQFRNAMEREEYPDIAGYTTVSLSYVRQGLTPDGVTLLPYFPHGGQLTLFCTLHHDVYEELFGNDPGEYFPESLELNREYGRHWSMAEIIKETTGSYESIWEINDRNEMIDKIIVLISKGTAIDTKSLSAMGLQLEIDPDDMKDGISGVIRASDFLKAIKTAQNKRRGVQLIYGPQSSFIDFIRKSSWAQPTDDSVVQVADAIPAHLIQALIPLGPYEQIQMGVGTKQARKS